MVQLKSDQTARLINKPYVNEGILRRLKIKLKNFQPIEMLLHFEEGPRSFHTFNIGSVGQRAVKLLTDKVEGLKKKSATQPQP